MPDEQERCETVETTNEERPLVMDEFDQELTKLINRHSLENGSDTPDFMLANYMRECLEVFNKTVRRRGEWYGHHQPEREVKARMGSS